MRRWRFEALLAALAAGILGFANIARAEGEYVWTGTGADYNWTTPANWGLEEGYPDAADAVVVFGKDSEVEIDGTFTVSNFCISAGTTVSLAGVGDKHAITGIMEIGAEATEGDKLIINNVNLSSAPIAGGASLSWYADIEIAANAAVTNTIYCNNKDNASSVAHLDLRGNLTGGGNLQLARNGHTSSGSYDGRGGVSLYGNNEAFAGTCIIRSGSSTRGPATFCSATAGSALARWVYPDSIDANTSARAGAINGVSGSTVKFGAYEGKSYILGCSGSNTGNTLELGALNTDFSCSFSARSSTAERANNNVTLRKVGTGTMTFGNEAGNPCINTYEMNGGTLKFANEYILRSATGQSSYINPAYKFTGGAVAFDASCTNSAGVVLDISPYIKNCTKPIMVETAEGQELVWAGALSDAKWEGGAEIGIIKKGTGTLTLTAAPTLTGVVRAEAGALVVPGGSALGTVDIAGGTLLVNAADGETITVNGFAEGTSADDVTIPAGFSAEWEEESGVWTATISKLDLPYVWTDATGDHKWATGGNWTIDGKTATFAPESEDTVVFPAEGSPVGGWTVELGGITRTVEKVTVDGETRFSGNALAPHTVDGAGKIVFGDDFKLVNASNEETLVIDNPVEVAAADETPATVYWTGNNRSIKLNGALTGSGTLVTRPASQANYSGVHFAGDASGFSGKIVAEANDIDRNMTNFESVDSVSENAAYQVTSGSGTFFSDSGTFRFGALSGKITQNDQTDYRNLTIEIGKLGLDDTLRGTFFNTAYPSLVSNRGHTIRKIGDGRLVFSGSLVKAYEVNGGELELTDDSTVRTTWNDGASKSEAQIAFGGGMLKLDGEVTLDLSANIVNSASAIAIDDGGVDRTWATALAASNTDGLVKKGAGTLTLSAVPQYKGVTFVKEGTLAVPLATELTTSPDTVLAYSDSTYKYYTHSEGAFLDPYALAAEKCTVTIDNLVYTNGTPVSYSSSYTIPYYNSHYPLGLWATNVTITVTPGSGYKNAKVSVNGITYDASEPVEYAVSAADIAKGSLAVTGSVEKINYVATTLDLGDGLTFIDFSYGGETYDSAEALAAAKIDRDDVAGANQLTVRVSLDTLHEIKSFSGLLFVGESEGVHTYNVMSTALTGTATITTRLCDNWKVTAPKVEHATIALTTGTAVDTDENDERIVYTFFDSESVTITYSPDSGYCLSGTAVFSWDKLASDQTIDPPTVSEASITIGGVGYATMAEAVANLSDGDTLTITSDDAFADDAVLTISKKTGVTVDLSGAEYSRAKIVATAGAEVTVKNGTITVTGTKSAAVAEDHATLKLEKVTITTDAPIGVGADDAAALEIDEDTVITASGEGAVGVWMEGGGTLKVAGKVTAANGTGVIQWGGVATTVKATANVSAKYAAVEVRGGSLTVENGATLTTTGSETSGEVIWNKPIAWSATIAVGTDSSLTPPTVLAPSSYSSMITPMNIYADSNVYTVEQVYTELTAALSAIPLSASTAPSSVSVKTKPGLSYGVVAVADLSELAGATPAEWVDGDGGDKTLSAPAASASAAFYRLVATPTAEVK